MIMMTNIAHTPCAGVQWCVCLLPLLSLLGLASGVPLGEGLGQHGRLAKLTGDRGQHIIKWTRLRSVTLHYLQYSIVQYSTVQ